MITIILLMLFNPIPTFSLADNTYYGQVINSGTFLYRENNSIIFEIPETYYVKISGYKSGYFTAEYYGTKGYVKADNIKVIKGAPQTPYLTTASFRLFASDYNKLKSTPNTLSETLATLPTNTSIKFIATTYSEELVENRGNSWYYCSYNDGSKIIKGYVYAGLCDGLNITPSTESFEYIPNPFSSPSSEYIEYLNTDGKLLVIAPIILISIFFVPLLLIPKYIKKSKRKPSPTFSVEDGKL